MRPTPVVKPRELIRVLERLGFVHTRTKGSHWRFEHPDGRKTTVPFHKARDIPRGLPRQIVTEDVGLSIDQLVGLL